MVSPPFYKRECLGYGLSHMVSKWQSQNLNTGLIGTEAHAQNHYTLKLPQLHDFSDFSLGLNFPICKMGGLARSLSTHSKPSLLCTLSLLNKRLASTSPAPSCWGQLGPCLQPSAFCSPLN